MGSGWVACVGGFEIWSRLAFSVRDGRKHTTSYGDGIGRAPVFAN